MPRKQNGWGKPDSFKVKSVDANIRSSKKERSSGYYPSDRTFGSFITRTPLEKLNLDSKWKKWFRGYNLFSDARAVDLTVPFRMRMFPGTDNEIVTTFTCRRYPTRKNDTAVRYVVRRNVAPHNNFGTINGIYNNPRLYPNQLKNNEIWTPIGTYNHLITTLTGERLRNGNRDGDNVSTVAILKTILTQDEKPAIFIGNTKESRTRNKFTTSLSDIRATQFIRDNDGDLNALRGQLIVQTGVDIFNPASGLTFEDRAKTIEINMSMNQSVNMLIIDTSNLDNDRLFVGQNSGPLIYRDTSAGMSISETFTLLKDEYQYYWGDQYFSAAVLQPRIDNYSLVVPPLYIDTYKVDEVNNQIEFTTIPYEGKLWMFTEGRDNNGYYVWSANGFATLRQSGERNILNIDADPWMDQTWIRGDEIRLSDAYGCNCPSFAHGMVRAPEQQYGSVAEVKGKSNRQTKYPLPSVGSNKDPQGLSYETAGILNIWRTQDDKMRVPACKHVIATMFLDDFSVLEPREVPGYTDQMKFTQEIEKEKPEESLVVAAERAEISFLDLLFSIAQVTQLDDTEIGSIVGGTPLLVELLEDI